MPRTTLDIDDAVLRELKRIQAKDGRTLGRLVSDLLAFSLAARRSESSRSSLNWHVAEGGALVDVLDRGAIEAALAEPADRG